MPPFRQDLSKAVGGQMTGRGGNVQKLGKAALRRAPAPPVMPATGAAPVPGAPAGVHVALPAPVRPMVSNPLMPPPGGGGGLGNVGRGMASYLGPPQPMDDMMGGGMPGGGPAKMPFSLHEGSGWSEVGQQNPSADVRPDPMAMAKPLPSVMPQPGVNSDAFAGAPPNPASMMKPNFAPDPNAGGGQAARIQALMARLRGPGAGAGAGGGGGAAGLPQQYAY